MVWINSSPLRRFRNQTLILPNVSSFTVLLIVLVSRWPLSSSIGVVHLSNLSEPCKRSCWSDILRFVVITRVPILLQTFLAPILRSRSNVSEYEYRGEQQVGWDFLSSSAPSSIHQSCHHQSPDTSVMYFGVVQMIWPTVFFDLHLAR
jgi:hypothetical protein